MKPSSSQTNSTDLSRPERNWRLHPVAGVQREPDVDVVGADPMRDPDDQPLDAIDDTAPPSASALLKSLKSGWIAGALERITRAMSQFESIVHRFAIESQAATDAAAIETALRTAASRIYPEGTVEFLGLRAASNDQAASQAAPLQACDPAMPSQYRDLLVCTGNAFHGRLRLRSAPGKPSTCSAVVIQQLNTLCIVAASALENLRHHNEWSQHGTQAFDLDQPATDRFFFTLDPSRPSDVPVCASLRDATFLSAIFPFALSQAQRYRESLSVLCIGVDRIGGIRQLLGNQVANRLLDRVGQIVASTIRSSDIVARLDDDRILGLLVRSPGYSALHVAQTICRAVVETSDIIPELPSVTVSIGVAAYPNHALNCFALFDAADDALVHAQSRGHGNVEIAPKSQPACPVPQA